MIPVNEPLLGEREVELVTEALRSGWISGAGPHIDQFERRWAAYCGRAYGVAVANGTVALDLALALLDLQPGDEVIMPSFTIISCATPVVLLTGHPLPEDDLHDLGLAGLLRKPYDVDLLLETVAKVARRA